MRTLPLAMAIANRTITVWARQVHMPPQQATYLRQSQAACVRKMSKCPIATTKFPEPDMPDRHVQPAIAAFTTRSRTKADSTEAASGG